ncbi:MAG: NADH-quinone oxidoreductase subunit NuoE [Pseudomonadota bacterium]
MKSSSGIEAVRDVDPLLALSAATRARIDGWLSRFPADRRRSAVIQSLMAAQEQNGGWLSDEIVTAVAKYVGIPSVWAYEVASFYSMLHLGRCGRHKVSICTNISCWLNGAQGLVEHAEGRLGIRLGESTPDGRIHLVAEEECLAACVRAPMALVDGHYHENLTPESLDLVLDSLT